MSMIEEPKRIGIIGGGVSGLVCAHLLGQHFEVTLFEKEGWLGGHTHTVTVDEQQVDTGFIVFNDRTYPNFLQLLSHLGINKRATEMSFSVSDDKANLEYNGHSFSSLFAQRRNLFRPRFWKMIWQILRFNKMGRQLAQQATIPTITLQQFLDEQGFDDWLISHYLLPMGAAIWSASIDDMRQYPLPFFLRFFHHHGLLEVRNRPQWYTVLGGSHQYVKAMREAGHFKLEQGNGVQAVRRQQTGVEILDEQGKPWRFDEVIFACHSDQALQLLQDPSAEEQRILSAIRYQENDVILHTDRQQLPHRRAAWASWNYRMGQTPSSPVAVTYNMNILQGLLASETYCVTLNPNQAIKESTIKGRYRYAHPQFDEPAEQAKAQRAQICGVGHTHFCGAYWYSGFHEDGVRSALDVCRRFGVRL